jgi:hypothetical protein
MLPRPPLPRPPLPAVIVGPYKENAKSSHAIKRTVALYTEVIKLAQTFSRDAIERLGGLIYDDDPRVAAYACNAILDRAYGRVKQAEDPPSRRQQIEAMTPEERRARIAELAEKAREVLESDGPVIEGEVIEDI